MTTTIQHLESIAAIQGRKVYEVLDNLVTQQLNTMKLFPLQMNTLSKEFEFFHDGKMVMAEADYSVDANQDHDSIAVVGEITDNEGNAYEIKDKEVAAQMRSKFWNEIEAIREELKAEKKSVLRDFGARVF